ncbi:putative phage tail protein [Grimontia sp. SpTr1]|uniref:YmfQ family protein n=1 Tax=Grimontia sp. SpTr1 TaxID=2995319 RepID=UPI00248CD30A|nr:putative phage tail protein [Grimontia sp. SpTr1]
MDRVTRAQSTDAWLDVLQQLMPQGIAWPRDMDANQTRLLRALATSLADIDALTDALQQETTPEQSHLLLSEYEQYLGLPECAEKEQTISSRRAAAESKDRLKGVQSAFHIEEIAARSGFNIKVREQFPHHCLRDCNTPIYPERYRHVLDIDVFTSPSARFTCLDTILTPLNSGESSPECLLNRYRLAGKYYDFFYREAN